MQNRDLIAYLKPIHNQFSTGNSIEFADFTGQVSNICADSCRLAIRLNLSAGFYCGRFQTKANAFDMSTAMIEMVRVPDGKRVPVGPWDLDHIHNVMAVPMMRTYVNGKLKGGLWFSMPGPEQIAEGRLSAEFGFEAQQGENELVLEFIERDRARMDWGRLESFELRTDDRRTLSLLPVAATRPKLFFSAAEREQVLARWAGSPEFEALLQKLRTEELVFLTDNSQGTLELASLIYALTGDEVIGARARSRILELAHAPTWSGRPDPLLMGGDNDRGIGLRLFHTALAWEFLQPLLDERDRQAVLAKAGEYLQKSYDFTLLQRAYMGYPTIEPHSLGTWNGAAIACMAFYDDLEIARHALPLYHGLFCDSLTLFPENGKAAWATYFPFHLVLYLAAAHTFGGKRPELSSSPFLDNLGEALLASYEVPNSQELQRGLRTREHRFLAAFLCRFHPTPGIESIYRAFAEKERRATGEWVLGIFDLLYAPTAHGNIAQFPSRPLYAKDMGDIISVARGQHTVAVSLSAGPKAGRKAAFTLMPHNREFPPSLGAIDVAIDGTPVLCNINMGQYGLDSALTNTMCFENGGALTNGQYLNGAIGPECTGILRKCLVGDRFLYAHVVLTHALDPKLQVQQADRIFVFDRQSGVIVLSDAFQGERPIRFATHLHCSGSITELSPGYYRLTGGQANTISGIKGGSKGLSDEEKGEIFVRVMGSDPRPRVVVEEPNWVPGYIYGLNLTGDEAIEDGKFPRYRRWRLEATEPVDRATFLFALSPEPGIVSGNDRTISLPGESGIRFGHAMLGALNVQCNCECLLWDGVARKLTAIGARSLQHQDRRLQFAAPVDIEYGVDVSEGLAWSQTDLCIEESSGFTVDSWGPAGDDGWKTQNTYRAPFTCAQGHAGDGGEKA